MKSVCAEDIIDLCTILFNLLHLFNSTDSIFRVVILFDHTIHVNLVNNMRKVEESLVVELMLTVSAESPSPPLFCATLAPPLPTWSSAV